MPRQKRVETEVERAHGHCAQVLMSDYGIPKSMHQEVCEEIAKLWKQGSMIHCVIITSIRGWQPVSGTNGLKYFLEQHQGYSPKNHKPESGVVHRPQGRYDSRGHYHQVEADDDW